MADNEDKLITCLALIRKDKGMSQADLAKASGVHLGTIKFYEAGIRDINKASCEIVYKLARALGVSMELICEFVDE